MCIRDRPDTLTPYDRLAQNEQIQLVHRLVNELPERQRTTMQLREVEGKSYKEIADILQITEEQVKVTDLSISAEGVGKMCIRDSFCIEYFIAVSIFGIT